MSELNALGMYLLVCLGFVFFALIEFSLVMFRNRSFSGCQKRKRTTIVEKRNKVGVLTRIDLKAEYQPIRKANEEIEKIMKSADKTDTIAFWAYLLLFILFNCFYWSHFLALHCQ